MADINGSDGKPGEGKTGPVKPPVLDLKPSETGKTEPGKTETKPLRAKESVKPSDATPPKKGRGKSRSGALALGAAILGGALGIGGAYGLASAGYWPAAQTAAPAPAPAADPRIAQFATAIPELETVTQTTQSELAALNQRIGALETAEPATPAASASPAAEPVDLSGIEGEVAALAERLDSLSANPQAESNSEAVDELRATLSTLSGRLDEIAARVGTAEAGLRTLDTAVSETTATLAEQPSDIGAVLQLPLILSGLETAFGTGRAFETELAALRAAAPAADVPTTIANRAETGLARPDEVATRFAAVLPDMLAGRPVAADAGWQDGALDWFRSAIALRPTGEMEGDTPEAVMSRLEAAIARRDFIAAESLLASLPAPMLQAAQDVPTLVSEQAEATRFLQTVRSSALSGEVAQ